MINQRCRLAYRVGLFLFSLYLLSYRGGFHSVDEVSMFSVTESMVKFGQVNTNSIAWTQWATTQAEAQGFFGNDGQLYSKKGLALSLAQAPLYGLAFYLPSLGMLQTVSLLNAFITALTGSLILMFLWRLGYSPSTAVTVSLIFGTATIAAVYAKYLFSEPLAGFLLLLAAYMLFTYRQEGGLRHVVIAGLAAGLAVLTRANNLFLLPIFGVYLLYTVHSLRSPRNVWLPVVVFTLSVGYVGILLMFYNDIRAGDPFQTGYDLTLFSPNVLLGLYKLLFSPLRGLFIYSPILLLSLPGWWLFRKTHSAEAWLFIGLIGFTLALFSAWSSGEGLSWGSRFLVPLVPFFAIALAPLISKINEPKNYNSRLIFYVLGFASFIVQFMAVAINPWVFLNQIQTKFGGQFFLEKTAALYDFRYSQIVGQIESWSVQNSDVAWWQPWGFDGLAFGLSLGLVILAGAQLPYLWGGFPRWIRICNPYPIFRRFVIARRITNSLSIRCGLQIRNEQLLKATSLFTLLLIYLLMMRYNTTDQQFGAPNDAYSRALNVAISQTGVDVPILTVAPYHYHVPMNRFKSAVPLIGFAQQKSPMPETALPLLKNGTANQTAWLVTVGFPPSSRDNAVEQWLTFNAYKAEEKWFDDVRLIRYSTTEPTMSRFVNIKIGEEIRLLEVQWHQNRQAGQLLSAKFVWRAFRRPSADYNLFLQLLTVNGVLVAQHDNPPNGGYTPTSAWFAGESVVSRHALVLPPNLSAGEYRLIAGLYNPTNGQRLAVESGGDWLEIGEVVVP